MAKLQKKGTEISSEIQALLDNFSSKWPRDCCLHTYTVYLWPCSFVVSVSFYYISWGTRILGTCLISHSSRIGKERNFLPFPLTVSVRALCFNLFYMLWYHIKLYLKQWPHYLKFWMMLKTQAHKPSVETKGNRRIRVRQTCYLGHL